jgi:hypothetical protein
MRTTSGTILGSALVFIALGCGSKDSPAPQPDVPIQPETPPTPAPAAKAVHELDPTKHVIPAQPVAGPVGGVEIAPQALVEGEYLVFRVTKPGTSEVEREVLLKIRSSATDHLPEGKRLVVDQKAPEGPNVPLVMMTIPGKEGHVAANGYAMTLELEHRKGGKLPGKIYLCLNDPEKSYLAGTFVASAPRLPIEPPGVEDVPLINGSVSVVGASAKPVLMTGYAASPNGTRSSVGIAALDIELGESPDGQRWTERADDKPRVTFLIAGDGKKMPSRFEHSKLTPGRYLAFAALRDGPAAWKWVDVGERTTEKVDLTIDASKVGGLEVTAPLGSLSKVQLAPADEPRRPALDPILFELIAMQLKLEQDIVQRKALFRNLAPGRYEVRDKASGQVRVVEIVAGKTSELDFETKPEPPKKADPAPDPKPKG